MFADVQVNKLLICSSCICALDDPFGRGEPRPCHWSGMKRTWNPSKDSSSLHGQE